MGARVTIADLEWDVIGVTEAIGEGNPAGLKCELPPLACSLSRNVLEQSAKGVCSMCYWRSVHLQSPRYLTSWFS